MKKNRSRKSHEKVPLNKNVAFQRVSMVKISECRAFTFQLAISVKDNDDRTESSTKLFFLVS